MLRIPTSFQWHVDRQAHRHTHARPKHNIVHATVQNLDCWSINQQPTRATNTHDAGRKGCSRFVWTCLRTLVCGCVGKNASLSKGCLCVCHIWKTREWICLAKCLSLWLLSALPLATLRRCSFQQFCVERAQRSACSCTCMQIHLLWAYVLLILQDEDDHVHTR